MASVNLVFTWPEFLRKHYTETLVYEDTQMKAAYEHNREYAHKYARLRQTAKPEISAEASISEIGIGLFAICDKK